MPKLIYKDPETDQESMLELGGHLSQMTIGRNPGNVLRVNNPSISRRHAEITLDMQSGKVSILDLGSSNGTYINGTRIHQIQMLQDGDRVRVGEFPIIFSDPPEDFVQEPHRPATAMGGFGASPGPPVAPSGNYVAEPFNPNSEPLGYEEPFSSPISMGSGQFGAQPNQPQADVPIYSEASDILDEVNIFSEPSLAEPSLPQVDPMPISPSYDSPVSMGNAISDAVDEIALGVMQSGLDDMSSPSAPSSPSMSEPMEYAPQVSSLVQVSDPEEEQQPQGPSSHVLQSEIEELNQRVRELEQEKQELHEALEKGASETGGASRITLERTRKERDRLSDERRTLMRQIKDLKRELEEAPDPEHLAQVEAQVGEQAETISGLEGSLQELQSSLQERDAQIETQQSQLDQFGQGLWALHETHLQDQPADTPQDVLSLVQSQMAEAAQRDQQAQSKISQLEQTVDTLNQGSSNSMETLIARDEQIAQQTAQIEELTLNLEHRDERIDHLLGNLEEQGATLASVQEQNEELRDELAKRPEIHEVDQIQLDFAALHQNFEQLTQTKNELVSERDELQENLAQTKQSLEDIQSRFDSVGEELDSYRRERDELKQERVAFARETEYLQVERRRLSEERDQVAQKVQALQGDKKRKKQIFDELKRDLQRIIKENNALEEANKSLRSSLDGGPQPEEFEAMRLDNAALKEELQLMRNQFEDLEQESNALTRSLGEMAEARDQLQAQLDAVEQQEPQEASSPEGVVDEDQQELLKALEEENAELHKKVEALEAGETGSDGDESSAQIQELEEALAALIEERDALEAKVKELEG